MLRLLSRCVLVLWDLVALHVHDGICDDVSLQCGYFANLLMELRHMRCTFDVSPALGALEEAEGDVFVGPAGAQVLAQALRVEDVPATDLDARLLVFPVNDEGFLSVLRVRLLTVNERVSADHAKSAHFVMRQRNLLALDSDGVFLRG